MNALTHGQITKAIHKSQHCQRNWDLSRQIPKEDLDIILTSVTQCPSKQNIAHYKVHAITNRDMIEKLHGFTKGFQMSADSPECTTNTQVLANLLLVFERQSIDTELSEYTRRTAETRALAKGDRTPHQINLILRDCHMAVGVAAGYANMVATLLGYGTGCCTCFIPPDVKEALGLDNEPLLMMGIGFKDSELPRRVSHVDHNFVFPTLAKQAIEVKYYT